MNSPHAPALPDYDQLAARFDRYVSLIVPVGLAVLDHLPTLPPDAQVLDVACGTGEPGLSLVRRAPGFRLLGLDVAAGMIEVAQAKAARSGLDNARFQVGTMDRLPCADGSLDAVLARSGLLLFGDVEASARELARVLRVGGTFSLAVWDAPAGNTLVNALMTALRPHVSSELMAPFDQMAASAAEGLRARILYGVGFKGVHSEEFTRHYAFPDPEARWQFLAGGGMFASHFAQPNAAAAARVRTEVTDALAAYRQEDDTYQIPHTCRVYSGMKSEQSVRQGSIRP